jgi:hypothetical protein
VVVIPRVLGTAAAGVIGLITLWYCYEQSVRAGSWDLAFLNAFPALVLGAIAAIGAWLVGRGWLIHVGTGESCASCGHQWVPEDDILLNHCQECGAPWRWFNGRVTGHRISKPLYMLVGAVLLALVPSAVVLDRIGTFAAFQKRSHFLMLKAVQTSQYADALADFDRLVVMGLADPALDIELAEAILRRRADGRPLPTEFIAWMHHGVEAGSLPQNLIDSWLGDMLNIRVEMSGAGEVGTPTPCIIMSRFMEGWGGVADVPQVVVTELEIDGARAVPGRTYNVIPASSLRGWTILQNAQVPAFDEPGVHVVGVRVWLFFGAPMSTVQFDANGRPQVPTASAMREFAWEGRLEVFAKDSP